MCGALTTDHSSFITDYSASFVFKLFNHGCYKSHESILNFKTE